MTGLQTINSFLKTYSLFAIISALFDFLLGWEAKDSGLIILGGITSITIVIASTIGLTIEYHIKRNKNRDK
jgi:hypothetical protein